MAPIYLHNFTDGVCHFFSHKVLRLQMKKKKKKAVLDVHHAANKH